MSPLVILQNDGLLSLFTGCTASDWARSNSARFSCANSSESFLEEFISKDTFSMLIKCRSIETACNSGSLKASDLEVLMLCMWAQYVSAGVLMWLIALSLFIYVLFGTSSTQPLCDQNWANVAPDWTLGPLQQTQPPQHGLGCDSRIPPLRRPSKPGHLLLPLLFSLTTYTKREWWRSPGRVQYWGFLVGLKWFVCSDVGLSPLMFIGNIPTHLYAHLYEHIWLHPLRTQSRDLIPLVACLDGFLFTWSSSIWMLFLNPLQTQDYQVSCSLAFLGCWPVHSSELWKEKTSRKSLLSRNVTVHVILCV